jgi:hypothetical protein
MIGRVSETVLNVRWSPREARGVARGARVWASMRPRHWASSTVSCGKSPARGARAEGDGTVITRPTVFVLGAGASHPYGFQLGIELVKQALRLLKGRDERRHMVLQACACPERVLEEFVTALERSASPSIDAFLEGRPEFLDVGKAVIAALLIPHESPISLFEPSPTCWYDLAFNRLIGRTAEEFAETRSRRTASNDGPGRRRAGSPAAH